MAKAHWAKRKKGKPRRDDRAPKEERKGKSRSGRASPMPGRGGKRGPVFDKA